jgi:hypothetical protein
LLLLLSSKQASELVGKLLRVVLHHSAYVRGNDGFGGRSDDSDGKARGRRLRRGLASGPVHH